MIKKLGTTKLKIATLLLILIFFSACMWNWYDVSIFENWVKASEYTKLYKIYEVPLLLGNLSYRVVYPPIPPLIYIATRYLTDLVVNAVASAGQAVPAIGSALGTVVNYVLRISLKLPLLIFTVGLAILLWKKLGSEAFYWTLAGVPTIVTLATYQFDPLVAFFLYLAVVGLDIPRAGLYITSLATALVVLTKPLAVVALLPLIYYLYKKDGIKSLIEYLAVSSAVTAVVILPFFLVNPYAFIFNVLSFHSERPPQYVSLWNIFVLLSDRNPEVVKVVNTVWLPILLVAVSAVLLLLRKNLDSGDKDDVVLVSLIIVLTILTFNKVVNPNYLLWAYPLVIHLAFSRRFKLRGVLVMYNVAAILATLWSGLYMLIPALVNDVVVIEETGELIPAREIIWKSLDSPLNETVRGLVKIGEEYYNYVKIVETYTNVLGAIIISAYSFVMLYLAVTLIRLYTNAGRSPRQI